jgi:signal transduction histidine kinase/DNA-binding NarL/FixJ family response regulator/CHASE3 domain sensor protein/HPt (histidine-containing phosphotransfer) domain-containing protein
MMHSNRKLFIGFGLAWGVLLAASLLSFITKQQLLTHNTGVQQSYTVMGTLRKFESEALLLDIAVKDFIATGDATPLLQVEEAESRLLDSYTTLCKMVQDQEQQKKLRFIWPYLQEHQAQIRAIGDAALNNQLVSARQSIASTVLRAQKSFIHNEFTSMIEREKDSLEICTANAKEASDASSIIILASFILSSLIGGLTLFIFYRKENRRRTVDSELRRNASLLDSVFTSSISGITVLEAIRKDGKIVDFTFLLANDVGIQIMGKPLAELKSKTLIEQSPGHKENGLFNTYSNVIESGKPVQFEQHILLPNDFDYFLEIACVSAGEDRIAISFVDATERKLAERRVRQQAQLIDGMLQNMPVVLFRYTYEGEIVESYGAGLTPAGIGQQELKGHNIYQTFSANAAEYREACNRPYLYVLSESQDSANPWAFDTYLFQDQENEGHIVGFSLNITEQKMAEKGLREATARAERASMFKSRFLANISHELRTPITAIIGFADVLSHEQLDERQREYLTYISSAGTTLLKLIGDVLDLTKIEEGKMSRTDEVFHLQQALTSVLHPYSFSARENGLAFDLVFGPGLPSYTKGDSAKLSQIMVNLVGNALKFTRKGGIEIHFELEADTHSQALIPGSDMFMLKASITDSGIGIDPIKQKEIFQAFTQADNNINRQYGGSGLGLAIVREMTELLGGAVDVQSPVEHRWNTATPGAKFTVRIPLKVAEAPADVIDEVLGKKVHFAGKARILLAEDNPVNQRLASLLLNTCGCLCDVADNGLIAVERARKTKYDLVLMDVQMPDMDGLEATRIIRSFLPLLPIMGISANASSEEVNSCFQAGMNDFLTKPYTVAQLHVKLRKLLSHLLKAKSDSPYTAQRTDQSKLPAIESSFSNGNGTNLTTVTHTWASSIEHQISVLSGIDDLLSESNPELPTPNLNYLISLTDNRTGDVHELAQAYFLLAQEYEQAYNSFKKENSYTDFAATCHKFKASVPLVGLEALTDPLTHLENLLRSFGDCLANPDTTRSNHANELQRDNQTNDPQTHALASYIVTSVQHAKPMLDALLEAL